MNLRHLTLRLRALLFPGRTERELHDELSFHVERETRKLIERGVAPDQARPLARRRFGSSTVVADQCRDQRGTALVDHSARDIRFALRSFARAPLAACTIVGTLATGLGVVAVLFTILNTVLFRGDAVPDIDEVYAVERSGISGGGPAAFSLPVFID